MKFYAIPLTAAFILGASSGAANAQGSAREDSATTLSDIVVTAQRREERLKDVPISISAFSGDSLERTAVTNTSGLTQITPGLNFYSQQVNAQPVIRGITSGSGAAGDNSNVALYVDGAYQAAQILNFFSLVDIERVEVLKGPQGTLYGRNAAGGAIVITTKTPRFTPEGELNLTYASFNERRIGAYLTGPLIGDKLAGSFAFYRAVDDGFKRDIRRGNRLGFNSEITLRAKLLWQITDNTRAVLAADYIHNKGNATFSGQTLDGNNQLRAVVPNLILPAKPNTVALSFDPMGYSWASGSTLTVDSDFSAFHLNSIASYRQTRGRSNSDSDGTYINAQHLISSEPKARVFSEEVVATSNSTGPLSWLVGALYYDEHVKQSSRSFSGNSPIFDRLPATSVTLVFIRNFSLASYAEATYKITDRLTAAAGARYTHDEVDFNGRNLLTSAIVPVGGGKVQLKSNTVTPRASLRFAITDQLNTYVTYSRGFKAAVFPSQSLGVVPVKPEIVDAFEGGIKGDLARNLSVSLAAYHYDYKNLQVQTYGATTAIVLLTNAARAKISGAELEVNYSPIASLDFRGSVAYTHGRYADFGNASCGTVPQATGCAQGFFPTTNAAGVRVGGNTARPFDASGKRLIRQPDWTGNLSATYSTDLAQGELQLTGNLFISSRTYYDLANLATQPGYKTVNATATWTDATERYRVQVFARNLFDRKYITSFFVTGTGYIVNYAKPANYGVTLSYAFGN